ARRAAPAWATRPPRSPQRRATRGSVWPAPPSAPRAPCSRPRGPRRASGSRRPRWPRPATRAPADARSLVNTSPRCSCSSTSPPSSVISRPQTGRSWSQRLKRRAGHSQSPVDRRRRARRRPDVEPHLRILHTVAEAVSRTLDVEEVLHTAVDALTRVTGHEISSLHLLSEDGKTLELRGERGMSARLREVNRTLPRSEERRVGQEGGCR